jgi:hypothetical protein
MDSSIIFGESGIIYIFILMAFFNGMVPLEVDLLKL